MSRKYEESSIVLGSPCIGPRFERIAQKFRSEVDRAEAIERAITSAAAKEDFDRTDALEAELARLDREHQRTWRQLSKLRFEL